MITDDYDNDDDGVYLHNTISLKKKVYKPQECGIVGWYGVYVKVRLKAWKDKNFWIVWFCLKK